MAFFLHILAKPNRNICVTEKLDNVLKQDFPLEFVNETEESYMVTINNISKTVIRKVSKGQSGKDSLEDNICTKEKPNNYESKVPYDSKPCCSSVESETTIGGVMDSGNSENNTGRSKPLEAVFTESSDAGVQTIKVTVDFEKPKTTSNVSVDKTKSGKSTPQRKLRSPCKEMPKLKIQSCTPARDEPTRSCISPRAVPIFTPIIFDISETICQECANANMDDFIMNNGPQTDDCCMRCGKPTQSLPENTFVIKQEDATWNSFGETPLKNAIESEHLLDEIEKKESTELAAPTENNADSEKIDRGLITETTITLEELVDDGLIQTKMCSIFTETSDDLTEISNEVPEQNQTLSFDEETIDKVEKIESDVSFKVEMEIDQLADIIVSHILDEAAEEISEKELTDTLDMQKSFNEVPEQNQTIFFDEETIDEVEKIESDVSFKVEMKIEELADIIVTHILTEAAEEIEEELIITLDTRTIGGNNQESDNPMVPEKSTENNVFPQSLRESSVQGSNKTQNKENEDKTRR
ncbi:unnamed protein product [Ceutorhynchus assimilis]|uniref:Uncharacterized protein n=1 Tax=Ceutorhynchus assimilis TaxID=467358 RepID=A0A9P0DHB3_9CUCU|nr:unnamed protein product [Ceutorhynchus assimilis]